MIPLLLRLCGYQLAAPRSKALQTFVLAPNESSKRMYRLWGRFPLLPFIDKLAFSDFSIVSQSIGSFLAFIWAESNPELFLEYTNGLSILGAAAPVLIIAWFLFPSVVTAILLEIPFLTIRLLLTPMAYIADVYQETRPLLQATTVPYIEPNSHFFRDTETLPQEIAKAAPNIDPLLPPLAFPEPDFLSPSERTIEGPVFSVAMHKPDPVTVSARAYELMPRPQPKVMDLDTNSSSLVGVLVELIKKEMSKQILPITTIKAEHIEEVIPTFPQAKSLEGLTPILPKIQMPDLSERPLEDNMVNLLLQLSDQDFNSWAQLYKALPDNCTTSDYWRMDFSRFVNLALTQLELSHPIDIKKKQRLNQARAFAEFMVNFTKSNRLLTGKMNSDAKTLLENACVQIQHTHPGYPFIAQLMIGIAGIPQEEATSEVMT